MVVRMNETYQYVGRCSVMTCDAVATHCNTLQHTATRVMQLWCGGKEIGEKFVFNKYMSNTCI